MPETLKQFSVDLLKDFKEALLKNQASALLEKLAKANDAGAGTFKVIVSTSDEDRQGDSLDQSKWNLANYQANPVVLWAHDYYSLPIGVCTNIYVEGNQLIAEGKFASADLNPFAAQVASLYEAGFVKATSVGFMIHEDGTLELLEFSFCPVPANPYALSLRQIKKLNLDIPQLVTKGLSFETKAESAGDACTMEDGTPGVLAEDKDNPGALICVPAEAKTEEPETEEPEPDTEEEKSINEKAGRQISAKNKEKITSVIKALEDLHETHGKSTNDVIAALKDLMGPEGNEGEEPKDEKISPEAPKSKVEVRDISRTDVDPFEAFMFGRQVLRRVDSEIGQALELFNRRFKERFSDRR